MSGSGIYEEDFEGSDHDSLYADSPSDGYFTQREHPQETFVENSSVQAESEAKAREAAEDRLGSSQATTPSQTSPTSPTRSPVWADEATPLLDAGPPPPDYAAAIAGRNRAPEDSDGASRSPADYGSIPRQNPPRIAVNQNADSNRSFAHRGDRMSPRNPQGHNAEPEWPFGNRGNLFSPHFPCGSNGNPFAGAGQPQSMGGARYEVETADEEHGSHRRRRSNRRERSTRSRSRRRCARGCCSKATILSVLLGLVVTSLIVVVAMTARATSKSSTPSLPKDDNNSRYPNSTDPQPGPEHPRNEICPFNWFTDAKSFDFEHPQNFTLAESIDPKLYMTGGVSGSVWIVAAPPEQEVDIRVWVSYASTGAWSLETMDYGHTSGALEMRFPRDHKPSETRAPNPCMDVAVGIYMKSHVNLDFLNITTSNLDIQSGQGPSGFADYFVVSKTWAVDSATFTTDRGSVKMPYWVTRDTRIETHSGSVKGAYALEDLLSVRTESGQVSINVAARAASATQPAPAVLAVYSHSGNVRVGVRVNGDVQDRDFQTRVGTHSGSISGNYVFSSIASFVSESGSIGVDVLPWFDSHKKHVTSSLRTESGSSSTTLCLLPPAKHPGARMNKLRSEHRSNSGSLNLIYPQEWEGTIEGITRSGSINLKGKDVKIYYDVDMGHAGKRVMARKGYGDSKLDFISSSGSVTLKVGDY